MKNLLTISDLTRSDVQEILSRAESFKEKHDLGIRRENLLDGKVVALVFEKPSLRTKVAFEVATLYLGGVPVFLSSSQILASGNNESGRESIPDIGRNLERYVDLIIARVYQHETLVQLAASVSKPVINALCDRHHPTQALADLFAIRSHKGHIPELKVGWVGDGTNVAVSLMQICALEGINFSIASPPGYEIPAAEQHTARRLAAESGSQLAFMHEPEAAVKNADIIVTDTYVSMGQEHEKAERAQAFVNYQVNAALMHQGKPDAVFMHCLPAHRGEEVTDEVIDSPQSIVFDEAECRLHIAKALLSLML